MSWHRAASHVAKQRANSKSGRLFNPYSPIIQKGPLLLRVVGCLPFIENAIVSLDRAGRRRTSIKGGNRGMCRCGTSSPQVYGDLTDRMPVKCASGPVDSVFGSTFGTPTRPASRSPDDAPYGARGNPGHDTAVLLRRVAAPTVGARLHVSKGPVSYRDSQSRRRPD